MQDKKVSIVIPTFNRKDFLSKCIDSCLSQTYPCEIIVCDHGSTDGTHIFMEKYRDKVIYIRRDKDFGPHFCWLEGILNASGEFVHLQFDDDWIEDTFIEKTVSLMDDDVGFSVTNATLYYDNKEEFKTTNRLSMYKKSDVYDIKLLERNILLRETVISPGCCLFRKEVLIDSLYQGVLPLKKVNSYHGVGPDIFVMLLSFLKYKKVGIVIESLAVFREHEGSITTDSSKDHCKKIKIKNAYREVVGYYRFLKFCHLGFKFFIIFSKTKFFIIKIIRSIFPKKKIF